jgi:DNA-binding response OmpR family regulator
MVDPDLETPPTVLVVDDEPDVADAYAARLEHRYVTTVAYGGEAALERISDDIDAVLLDRRMPDLHGDDVLDEIRDRGYDCAVIMVTAVDPDLNILEMEFDDYLSKPVSKDTLLSTLEQHVDPAVKNEDLEEFFSLLSKLEVLEAEHTQSELQNDDQFKQLAKEASELADELREEVDDFESLVSTYRDISRTGRSSSDLI